MDDFFLFLMFVLIVSIFIMVLKIKNSISKNFLFIKKQIFDLTEIINNFEKIDKKIVVERKISETSVNDLFEEENKDKEKIINFNEKEIPIKEKNVLETKSVDNSKIISTKFTEQTKEQIITPPKQAKKKKDIEKFIGENLINKIGIVILVLSLFFFVQYAIGKGWVNDAGRVAIGIVSGGILIAIAHKLRKTYTAFSSVLAGGGIAVLYSTIALGFQLYSLFSQTQAFLIMVIITGFAIALSLAYNKKTLTIIAIIGGFITPLSLSTGEGNYIILFSYILILDIGMLVLAYFKKWNLVNIVTFILTVFLFAGWTISTYHDKNSLPYIGTLIFATVFYLVFFSMNIINNLKENNKFSIFDFMIVISNTILYYAAGMFIIDKYNENWIGIFTILIAIFNFVFAYFLYKNKKIDKNFIFLLIGLVLSFVSLTAPVQLNGNYITMFWAIESVLLLWLSQKTGIKLLKIASFIVTFLMIISLIMDWQYIYINPITDTQVLTIILNKGFITGIVAIISIVLNINLLKSDKEVQIIKNMSVNTFKLVLTIFLILSLYIVFLLEISYQIKSYFEYYRLVNVVVNLYNYIYITAVAIWASKNKIKFIFETISIFAFIGILIYIFDFSFDYVQLRNHFLRNEVDNNFIILHLINSILILFLSFYVWKNFIVIFNKNELIKKLILWVSIIVGIVVLSFDIDNIILLISNPNVKEIYEIEKQSHLIAWPILWGITAFVLMILGMKKNMKLLRIISLAIFFFTLLKLFLVDVWNMSEGGKIAAFISLGIILLTVSFLYQKLRKLIFEENEQD